jgi:hypothetical protein
MRVADEHARVAAENLDGLETLDGQALTSWFRALIMLYQKSFLRLCRCLHKHPRSAVPFSILLWQVMMHDHVILTVLGGHAVAKPRNTSTDISISLGLHLNAPLRYGMLDLSLGCSIEHASPFTGCIALKVSDPKVAQAIDHCPTMPFRAMLKGFRYHLQIMLDAQALKMPASLTDTLKSLEAQYSAAFSSTMWEKELVDLAPSNELRSAEALMGMSRRSLRSWTLGCSVESPQRCNNVIVLLPFHVQRWAQHQLELTQQARHGLAPTLGDHARQAEHLVEGLALNNRGDASAIIGQVAAPVRCTLLDTALQVLESMSLDYLHYCLGLWKHKLGVRGNPAGRQPMPVAAALKQQWLKEADAPLLGIFKKSTWVQAAQGTRPTPKKQVFSTPRMLHQEGTVLFHFAMTLLNMVEMPIWRGTPSQHMLSNALSGSHEPSYLYEKVALATAMKGVFSQCFPVRTVFAVHSVSGGKFQGAEKFWQFE